MIAPRVRILIYNLFTYGDIWLGLSVAVGRMRGQVCGLVQRGTALKTKFSIKLQARGVNATAYAAKLLSRHTSVIIPE